MDPIKRIATERERQITEEGYTARHDDAHVDNELPRAAMTILLDQFGHGGDGVDLLEFWPWNTGVPHYNEDDALVKAGALLVAEMERRDRADGRVPTTPLVPGAGPGVREHAAEADLDRIISDQHATFALGWLSAELAGRADAYAGNAPDWFPEPPEWLELWRTALRATRDVAFDELGYPNPETWAAERTGQRSGPQTHRAWAEHYLAHARADEMERAELAKMWLDGDHAPSNAEVRREVRLNTRIDFGLRSAEVHALLAQDDTHEHFAAISTS
jgi:hypothetical protein